MTDVNELVEIERRNMDETFFREIQGVETKKIFLNFRKIFIDHRKYLKFDSQGTKRRKNLGSEISLIISN